MFGRRADGRRVKDLMIIEKAEPYFMPQRIDGVNLYKQQIMCKKMDEFILKERQENGVHFNYTEILIAAAVRMLYERPKANRFIVNCQIFQRNEITISMSIKPKLTDDCDEVTLKFHFTGRENIYDVKKIVDDEIKKNSQPTSDQHGTTKAAKILGKMPYWMFKVAMKTIRFLDRYGLLPKSLIDLSPFHTSMFITDLKSIKLDKVYHHLYNFGTTTIFGALGKVKYVPVSDRTGEIHTEKVMDLGLSLDERVADGLYYGNSVKKLLKYIENPELLKASLSEVEVIDKAKKRAEKKAKRAEKKRQKREEKGDNIVKLDEIV